MNIFILFGALILFLILVLFLWIYNKGFINGYNSREEEIIKLKNSLEQIKGEFKRFIQNKNREVKKFKEELEILRNKQAKIKVFIKGLRQARNNKKIDLMKYYVDRLLREYKK